MGTIVSWQMADLGLPLRSLTSLATLLSLHGGICWLFKMLLSENKGMDHLVSCGCVLVCVCVCVCTHP